MKSNKLGECDKFLIEFNFVIPREGCKIFYDNEY